MELLWIETEKSVGGEGHRRKTKIPILKMLSSRFRCPSLGHRQLDVRICNSERKALQKISIWESPTHRFKTIRSKRNYLGECVWIRGKKRCPIAKSSRNFQKAGIWGRKNQHK